MSVGAFGNSNIAYATVVRTHETLQLPATLPKLITTCSYEDWNYIVYGANAMTETDLLGLLNLLRA